MIYHSPIELNHVHDSADQSNVTQVFTAERFQGNPLAVVAVHGNTLTRERKQLIAREFGYSETVFLHDAPGPGHPRKVEIFTPTEEIPFAGHPVRMPNRRFIRR